MSDSVTAEVSGQPNVPSAPIAAGQMHIDARTWSDLTRSLEAICELAEMRIEFPRQHGNSLSECLDQITTHSGVPIYEIRLPSRWWRDNYGTLLGINLNAAGGTDGFLVLVPKRTGGYRIFDPKTRQFKKLDRAQLGKIGPFAWKVVRTFDNAKSSPFFVDSNKSTRPNRLLGEMIRFCWPTIRREFLAVVLSIAFAAVLGFLAPIGFKLIIDLAIPVSDIGFLLSVLLVLIGVNFTQGLIALTRGYAMLRLQMSMTESLQTAVWWRLMQMPVSFHRKFVSGDLVHRSTMIASTSQQLGNVSTQVGVSAVVATSSLIMAIFLSPILALAALPLAFVEATLLYFIVKRNRRESFQLELVRADILGYLAGIMRGILRIRSTGGESHAFSKCCEKYSDYVEHEDRMTWLKDMAGLLGIAIPAASSMVVFALGYNQVSSSSALISLGSFAAFISAYRTFATSLNQVGNLAGEISEARANLQLLEPVLSSPQEKTRGKTQAGELTGRIEVCNAVFHYPNNPNFGVHGVSLECHPGEYVGIMGPSGSGKSTLIRLLLGFEKVDSGSVEFDGLNVDSLNMDLVRRQIGCVLQGARIQGGTLAENIEYGRKLTEDEIWDALKLADFDKEIRKQPLKLQTIISENGTNLSGGQRQRILLARALAGKPKLLILDEALSGLDVVQQDRIIKRLRQMNMTILMISHRLDSLLQVDRIYRIERGRVVQSGIAQEFSV